MILIITDTLFFQFECCGVDGKEDYATNAGGIPLSCCAPPAEGEPELAAGACGTTSTPYEPVS